MDEIGNETGEVSEASEVGAYSDADEIDMADVSDEELAADFGETDADYDSEISEQSPESQYESEWDDEDLEADYRAVDELEGGQVEDDGLGAEIADINENVPPEWENIEGEHDIEADAENVNPNYDPEKNGEWENNCQSCAPAYEMRRRGYDVEAKPFTDENEYLSRNPEAAWDNPDVQTTEGNGKADIEHQMQEWGDGSRAEVVAYWKEGGGHAFCAEQVNGETKFVDPQVASSDDVSHDAGAYFDHVRDDGSTRFWRTDDAKPSRNIEDCCKEAER